VLVKALSLAVVPLVSVPLVYLFIRVAEVDLGVVVTEVLSPRTGQLVLNTAALVVAVTITALAVGVTQAYVVVRTSVPLRRLLTILATVPLAVPSYVAAYGWLGVVPGFNGFVPAWLVLSVATAPLVFLTASAALARTSRSVDDVAQSISTSRIRRHILVTWPILRSSVWSSGLLVALYVIADFGAVSLLRYDTFTRAIFNAYRSSFDRSLAAILGLVVVVLTLVLVVLYRRALKGEQSGPVNVVRPSPALLRNSGWPHALLMSLWTAIGVGVPFASIIAWAVAGTSGANVERLVEGALNSMMYGLSAATLAVALGIVLVVATLRYRFTPAHLAESTSWLIHALPALVVALSFTFVGIRLVPDLYQTHVFVVLGLVVLFLPNAISAIEPALRAVPPAWHELAQSLGMRPSTEFARVTLPVITPGLLAGWALVVLVIVRELPLTLLLRPNGVETLATRLWTETSAGAFAAAAPYAVTLVALAGIPAWLVSRGLDPQRKMVVS
jgi:iron(III) transport system permease protein